MKSKKVKGLKSFLIEQELLEQARSSAQAEGVSLNEFIWLAIKDRVSDGSDRLDLLLKNLNDTIEGLKKQAINLQIGITGETLALSQSIKKATEESTQAQEEMTKQVVAMLANQAIASSAVSAPLPARPRRAGPDFSSF